MGGAGPWSCLRQSCEWGIRTCTLLHMTGAIQNELLRMSNCAMSELQHAGGQGCVWPQKAPRVNHVLVPYPGSNVGLCAPSENGTADAEITIPPHPPVVTNVLAGQVVSAASERLAKQTHSHHPSHTTLYVRVRLPTALLVLIRIHACVEFTPAPRALKHSGSWPSQSGANWHSGAQSQQHQYTRKPPESPCIKF